MCYIYASTDPELFTPVTKSVRLSGVVSSVRLEKMFWASLEKIASEQNLTLPKFLSELYDEIVEIRGSVTNFSSQLRVIVVQYNNKQEQLEQSVKKSA
ncbi:MAG: ribbon-helix-helix domain-containing protein [Hyphomicrobiales bacterium]